MSTRIHFRIPRTQLQRLARSVAAVLALAPPTASAGTVFVTNCLDNGDPGDLRHAISAAHSLDTIDLSACANSTISLHNGEILIPQETLFIQGPGKTSLVIDGKYNNVTQHDRIFEHSGVGSLVILDLTIGAGYLVTSGNPALGGCILSAGPVALVDANVVGCQARAANSAARGGAIYSAQGTVYVTEGLIAGNYVRGDAGTTKGGAIAAYGVQLTRATVTGNRAAAGGSGVAVAGGVFSRGSSSHLTESTISDNSADTFAGGALLSIGAATGIRNSTISGNTAGVTGGLEVSANLGGTLAIEDSTIAFNRGLSGTVYNGHVHAPGLALANFDSQSQLTVTMQSTLVANNTYGFPATARDLTTYGNVPITGSDNLIFHAPAVAIPQDTLHDICPLLGPLRDNGGPTLTHALLSHSPGIDQGSSPFGNDQRGLSFVRPSGPAPDIGAYEVQQDEIVFDAGFDGCPAL